jgi:hypothetical protein
MSGFRQGFLSGESYQANDPATLLQGEFDLVVLSSSWDRRSVCVAQAKTFYAEHGILLLFSTRDDRGLRESHDRILTDYLNDSCSERHVISGDSADYRRMWPEFENQVISVRTQVGRPLRILVDLSTCPRYFSLGLLARAIRGGIADRVSFFYAEGTYPEEASDEDKHELFTAGGWEAVAIPGLEGEWDPEKRRMYLVSVGFEGSKTLRLISRAEPDRVALLFPDPGVREEYVKRTWENNKPIIDAFRIQSTEIIRAPAGDAIFAWSAIASQSPDNDTQDNVYYVCCGTKSHSLALGLRALALQTPAVLYIAPDRHRVVDTSPLGIYWRFDIADVSSLSAQ